MRWHGWWQWPHGVMAPQQDITMVSWTMDWSFRGQWRPTTSSRHEGVAKDQQNKSKGWQMAGNRGVTSIVILQYWKFYSTIYSLGLEGRKCTIFKILAFENWSPRIKSSNIITDIFTLSTLSFYSYYDAMVCYTFN